MSTVLLPQNKVPQKLNRELLPDYCQTIKNKVERLYQENESEFIIQDGPPYANGDLHLGHLMNKTLKDFYIKYHLSNGKKVRVRFGWDCHGLPIENRAKSMEGDLFENCRQTAFKYKDKQKSLLNDSFAIFSTEPDYMTLSDDFIARELTIYNQLKEQGAIFRKNKPTWYSPVLNTVLANSEIEYKDVTDESLYFKFKTEHDLQFLVWTTTEWTVAGNQAVCLNPNINYCVVYTNEYKSVVCSETFAKQNGWHFEPIVIEKITYYYNHKGEKCPVLFDEFVTDTETGIVHLSGGHGDEDYNVLLKNNVEPKNVVGDLTTLAAHINNFRVSDEFVFKRVPFTHSYPVDWRAKEKVVKVLTEQTYLDFDWTKIKEATKKIKLSSKDRTRLEGMLFSRKDWCLSRQRKWGVQIPGQNDILDVWFDSGTVFSMYDRPANLYIEGIDQHRGWFQSSIIIAAMVDRTPTKRILTHGFVTDESKMKFAKSSENYQPLKDLCEKYNPDVLRLWVYLSDYKNDVIFSEEALETTGKQYFRLRNLSRYFVNNLHRESHDVFTVRESLKAKVSVLRGAIEENIEMFDLSKAVRSIITFINDYSSSLTEDLKNEFYEADIDSEIRVRLENEFYFLSTSLSDILFPFLPFLSTELELGLKG